MDVRGPVRCAVFAALCLSSTAGTALAKDPSRSAVDEFLARAERAADEPEKAATFYGQAVAAAQTLKDLLLERKAADALEAWFAKVEPRTDVRRSTRPRAREVLAEVMAALDPKRSGAMVSAHALAAEVLADSVALGDGAHVEDAAKVLTAHAGSPKPGAAAAALARWAEGMAAEAHNDAAKADAALEAAAKTLAANGWLAQAASAATELAALRLAAQDDAKAAQALAIAAAAVRDDTDAAVIDAWILVAKGRLLGASPAALEPLTKVASVKRPAGAAMKGGRGGNGARGGGGDVSSLGRLWSRLGPDKPVVSVTRDKTGLTIRPTYRTEAVTLAVRDGQRTWEDEGGVTLLLAGPAVTFAMIDLSGLEAQPGDVPVPSRVRAFYLLAEGETWTVTKAGTVTVGK